MPIRVEVTPSKGCKARVKLEQRDDYTRDWNNAGVFEVPSEKTYKFFLSETKRIHSITQMGSSDVIINPTKPDETAVVTINESGHGL